MYCIDWKKKARKQLDKIDNKKAQNEIFDAAAALGNFPNVGQVKQLTNHKYGYRLRVGRYRVFFDVDNAVRIISIEEVKKRYDRTY